MNKKIKRDVREEAAKLKLEFVGHNTRQKDDQQNKI